jgi:hypothetical protein
MDKILYKRKSRKIGTGSRKIETGSAGRQLSNNLLPHLSLLVPIFREHRPLCVIKVKTIIFKAIDKRETQQDFI